MQFYPFSQLRYVVFHLYFQFYVYSHYSHYFLLLNDLLQFQETAFRYSEEGTENKNIAVK